jgi:hypothetical protein
MSVRRGYLISCRYPCCGHLITEVVDILLGVIPSCMYPRTVRAYIIGCTVYIFAVGISVIVGVGDSAGFKNKLMGVMVYF